ncbi:MAG: phosphoribosylglycinamide formyltransferase [Clostridia bacterium]
MLAIAVLVSGGGTNLQALLDAQRDGALHSGAIALVVSSKPDAYALRRAELAGVKALALPKEKGESAAGYGERLIRLLAEHHIELVVLAGFLLILDACVIRAYEGRILNVHPSLIPAFCGEGFYGLRVHEAALARGVKLTGATVHLVNEIADGGRILAQRAVEVLPGDSPETLQKRVMEEAEWVLLPRETERLASELGGRGVWANQPQTARKG